MNNAFVMEDAVAERPDDFQIRLPVLALVQAFKQMGEHGLEGTREERSLLLVMVFEKACPEAKLEFGHDSRGGHRLAGLPDLGFGLGYFLRRPWSESKTGVVIPILSPHQGGHMAMDGVAERDFAKLERRIKTLAKSHIEKIPSERGAEIRCCTTLADRICRESFRGKSLLDLLKKGRVHRSWLPGCPRKFALTWRHGGSKFPSLTPELPLPPLATVTGAGVSFWADSERIADAC